MDRVSSLFRMDGIIRATMYVIRKMDMGSSTGPMADHIQEIGCKGNNKVKEYTQPLKGSKSTTSGTKVDACVQTPINCKSQNDLLYISSLHLQI